MPQYKKKNVKKYKRAAKNVITEEVVMKRSRQPDNELQDKKASAKTPQRKKISVIRGNKIKNRNRRLAVVGICLLLVSTVFVISLLTPTGIVEAITNLSTSIKFGSSYPVKLSGGTLINTVPQGNHIFLVSTTNFECYNNNGKNIFSYQHGYLSPIICVSQARTLIYDQSGKNYSIYNLSREVLSNTTEREILTADITRNGNYAIATLSDSYSSQVAVFNKQGEKIYEWFCADYIINSVMLSPDGDTLAVSAVNASDGAFVSKLYILDYSSADPEAQFDYNALLLGLRRTGNSGFSCILENTVDFFTWKNLRCNTFSTEENVLLSRNYKSNTLVVTGRLANKNENNITVFDASGDTKHSFVFNGIIDSIEYKGTDIYILSEKTVYHYTVSGELVGSTNCDFGTRFILPISQKEIAAVSDNNIVKLTF